MSEEHDSEATLQNPEAGDCDFGTAPRTWGRAITWVCVLGLAGCGHSPPVDDRPASAPPVSGWAHRLGPIVAPLRDCVAKHPDAGATIIGARTLKTGEIAVMTRTPATAVRVCVHDGDDVVYEKDVAFLEAEVEALPFVTLVGAVAPVETQCMSVRPLLHGIVVLGWLAVPHCQDGGGAHAPR